MPKHHQSKDPLGTKYEALKIGIAHKKKNPGLQLNKIQQSVINKKRPTVAWMFQLLVGHNVMYGISLSQQPSDTESTLELGERSNFSGPAREMYGDANIEFLARSSAVKRRKVHFNSLILKRQFHHDQ